MTEKEEIQKQIDQLKEYVKDVNVSIHAPAFLDCKKLAQKINQATTEFVQLEIYNLEDKIKKCNG